MFANRDEAHNEDDLPDGQWPAASVPEFQLIKSPDTSLDLVESISQAIRLVQSTKQEVIDNGQAQFSGDELSDAVLKLEELRRGLDSLSLTLLGELHARGTTDEVHGMRTGPWLAREAGLPRGATNARVRMASKLRSRFEAISKALNEGRIGFQHAETLTNACNHRIENQWESALDDLIKESAELPFNYWRNRVKALAELLDQDGGHKPGDDITDNVLRLSSGYGGTLQIQGQFAGEHALIVSKLIESKADELFRRHKQDAKLTIDLDVPPRRTLLALALVELLREGASKSLRSTSDPKPDVSLIINAEDPNLVTDPNGIPIGDTAASTLLCDPVLHPVVLNIHGVVTHLGKSQRLASQEQRKAIAHRDGGCSWPGCENPPSWTDAHHIQHWTHGGATDLPNLASLCRHHHGVTHRKGWKMHTTDDQWFWWRSPTGSTFWSQRHGRQRTGPTPNPGLTPNPPGEPPTGSNPRNC